VGGGGGPIYSLLKISRAKKFQTTSRLREVQFPRKFRPREDFPSNRSSELENPIELEKFTELKLNLDGETCKIS
jgi:hypothetical protein